MTRVNPSTCCGSLWQFILHSSHSGYLAVPSKALAKRFIHYTSIWGLRQAPHLDMPIVGLMEVSLHQRTGNRIAVVVNPSHKTGLKRQEPPSLTTRILIRKPPYAE